LTLATTDSRVQYTGNGSTTVWDFNFIVPEASSLFVTLRDLTTGDVTELEAADYSVTGIGDEDGGAVTYPTSGPAITNNFRLTIYREVPYTQPAAFTNQDGFYPEVVEDAFDRVVMQTQQLVDAVSRGLTADPSGEFIDALGLEIQNLGAPTTDNSAVRKIDIDNIVISSGNVPGPGSGATNRFLRALSATTWGWVTFTLAMITDASALGRQLMAAGSAAAMRALLEIPNVDPVEGDPGDIKMAAYTTPPTGWLKCDGSAVNRTTYAPLFAAIGTAYGTGNGSTTFNLPDFRGEFLRGWDDSRGVDTSRVFGSSQSDLVKAHTHTATASTTGTTDSAGDHQHEVSWDQSGKVGGAGFYNSPAPSSFTVAVTIGGQPDAAYPGTDTAGAHSHTINSLATTVSVAANTGAENRPRNVTVQYFIKT